MDKLTPEQRSQLMSRIAGRDTAPEMLVRSTLHRLGYRYRLHSANLPERPDLVFVSRKKVIFVNGCFWHGHHCKKGQVKPATNAKFWVIKIDTNRARDRRVQGQLRRLGWRVLTVWECELRKGAWMARVLKFLD
jgi:DNA mismatch endonuclease (patch repair protein)